jgi:hypothetical protein
MADITKHKPTDVIAKIGEQTKLFGEYGEPIRRKIGDETYNLVLTGQARLFESFSHQTDSQGDRVASTQAQKQTCRQAVKRLMSFRQAISKAFPKDKVTKEEFGIGMEVKFQSPEAVHSGIVRFVTAAEAAPEKAAAALLSTDDIARLKSMLDEIVTIRANQTGMKTSAKASTLARKKLQADIEAAMTRVVTAATLVFEDQPEVVALFRSTLPKRKRSSRKAASETEGGSTTPSSETIPE